VTKHFIGKDEAERQALFGEACVAIERKLREEEKTMRTVGLVYEVASEREEFNRDMVQQALWALIEAERVKVNANFEVSLAEPLGIV
jgi:hypothetical protein